MKKQKIIIFSLFNWRIFDVVLMNISVRNIPIQKYKCLKESTCETRKNIFYLTSKALFILEIIKF